MSDAREDVSSGCVAAYSSVGPELLTIGRESDQNQNLIIIRLISQKVVLTDAMESFLSPSRVLPIHCSGFALVRLDTCHSAARENSLRKLRRNYRLLAHQTPRQN